MNLSENFAVTLGREYGSGGKAICLKILLSLSAANTEAAGKRLRKRSEASSASESTTKA